MLALSQSTPSHPVSLSIPSFLISLQRIRDFARIGRHPRKRKGGKERRRRRGFLLEFLPTKLDIAKVAFERKTTTTTKKEQTASTASCGSGGALRSVKFRESSRGRPRRVLPWPTVFSPVLLSAPLILPPSLSLRYIPLWSDPIVVVVVLGSSRREDRTHLFVRCHPRRYGFNHLWTGFWRPR